MRDRWRTRSIRGAGWLVAGVALLGSGWALLGNDLVNALLWWLSLFLLGVAVLPVTQAILGDFHDRGYPFSKVLGVGLVAYLTWLTSSMRLVPFSRWAVVGTVVLVAAAAYSARGRRLDLARLVTEQRRMLVGQECLFFALLVGWASVRGALPDIHGTEKFMDHGFAAAISRSPFMPPPDMWFAGESINYYYFGHYVLAFMSRLSGVRLAVAYNLMIATILAFCFTLTLSLAAQIARSGARPSPRRWLLAGLVSASLLTFGGNLHTFVFAGATPAVEILRAETTGSPVASAEGYSYVEATRYVGYRPPTADKTIHEFPFYSFVVADLHAHVSNIPFVLTLLAILTGAFLARGAPSRVGSFLGISLPLRFLVPVAGSLAICRITNAWDLPIYLGVTLAVVFARSLAENRSLPQGVTDTTLTTALVLVICWALTLPFNAHFENHYSELGWVHTHTPLGQLAVLWGVPLLFLVLYGAVGLAALPSKESAWNAARHPLATFARLPRGDQLTLALAACAGGLVMAPEVVYVQDIYAPEFYRANTYFKVGYQAFILFGVLIGVLADRVLTAERWRGHRGMVRPLLVLVLVLPLLYPPFAVSGFYGRLGPGSFKGLDGLAFLDREGRGDGPAVRWLNETLSGSPVVLEANGDSFTEAGRVSMATGLPTILGWYAHEALWRGSMEVPEDRARAVEAVYESGDVAGTLAILGEYGVRFIVVGDLERERFPNLNEEKLLHLGVVVFESGGTRIIQVRP
ncbi:MAG: DUF2298 domain-containing protein [Acidobacteria bacterium]|nr:DUF2298 domain-containing protein [Acidobacteriota bacterium]